MRERRHIFRSTNVCDETCIECKIYERVLPATFLAGILVYLLLFLLFSAPLQFPTGSYVRVKQGSTLQDIAQMLKDRQLIRSVAVFKASVKFYGSDRKVYAGEYFFSKAQSALQIAQRLAHGDYELTPVRTLFWEGTSIKEMAKQLAAVPDFDASEFVKLTEGKEGYLFPDTYFILPGQEPATLVKAMEANFDLHIASASTTLQKSGKPLKDLVIMASLLEKEASHTYDRRVIAGILWNRIDRGMPLQVDAVFPYIIGKNTFQVTLDDLKIDSPYNTYKYKGLPIGPITNPGLESVIAAATPVKSNYLFYLSDKQGNFHYATTYAQHLANKHKYLD